MIYGYARVSTATQGRDGNSLEDQVAALEKYGCQKIVKEAFTGKTMDRPKFLSLLEVLQEGDTLVVCKLDRFARTAIEGVQVVRELFERGVRVHIIVFASPCSTFAVSGILALLSNTMRMGFFPSTSLVVSSGSSSSTVPMPTRIASWILRR